MSQSKLPRPQAALLRGESTEERAHNGFEPSTSSNGKSIEACSSDGLMEPALRLDPPVHHLSIIVPVAAGAICPATFSPSFASTWRESLVRARGTRSFRAGIPKQCCFQPHGIGALSFTYFDNILCHIISQLTSIAINGSLLPCLYLVPTVVNYALPDDKFSCLFRHATQSLPGSLVGFSDLN